MCGVLFGKVVSVQSTWICRRIRLANFLEEQRAIIVSEKWLNLDMHNKFIVTK